MRISHDPYGDFVVRVMNSARVALNQSARMSEGEADIVERVRDFLCDLDPYADDCAIANIGIQRREGS